MDKVERIDDDDLFDVIKRLLGLITPIGESNQDEIRYDNLQQTTKLTNSLVNHIIFVGEMKHNGEASIKKARNNANLFLEHLKRKLIEHFEDLNNG